MDANSCQYQSETRKEGEQTSCIPAVGSLLLDELVHGRDFRKREVGIQRMQLLANRRRELQGINRGTHDQGFETDIQIGRLSKERSEMRHRRQRRTAVHRVSYYSNNCENFICIVPGR